MQVRFLDVNNNFRIIVLVICCKLLVDKNVLRDEKDEFVNVFIEIVVRNRVDSTIRLARIVNKACQLIYMHIIDKIFRFAIERITLRFLLFVILVNLVFVAFNKIAILLLSV